MIEEQADQPKARRKWRPPAVARSAGAAGDGRRASTSGGHYVMRRLWRPSRPSRWRTPYQSWRARSPGSISVEPRQAAVEIADGTSKNIRPTDVSTSCRCTCASPAGAGLDGRRTGCPSPGPPLCGALRGRGRGREGVAASESPMITYLPRARVMPGAALRRSLFTHGHDGRQAEGGSPGSRRCFRCRRCDLLSMRPAPP